MFNNKDYQIFGAYNDDILCGYLIVHIGDKIDIEKIFVDKNFRKQGIGTMLIKHIINSFSNKKIILEVNENNTIAISFYKALGFKLLTTRKDYYGVNENAIILER
jgi:ribosomal-protein-alanine N-acetyltransferase